MANNVRGLFLTVVLHFLAVHLGGGIWGVLAAPIFNKDTGILYAGDGHSFLLLGWNLVGLIAINAWSVLLSFLFFFTLRLFKMLRVSDEIQLKGEYTDD